MNIKQVSLIEFTQYVDDPDYILILNDSIVINRIIKNTTVQLTTQEYSMKYAFDKNCVYLVIDGEFVVIHPEKTVSHIQVCECTKIEVK